MSSRRVIPFVLGAAIAGGCVQESPSGADPHVASPPPSPRAVAAEIPVASSVAPPRDEAPTAPKAVDPSVVARGVADAVRAVQSAACLAHSRSDARAAPAVHRWVDAAGVTHYSDQAPAAGIASHRVIEVHGLPPVKVEASGYDVNLPADLERRAVVDALAVQRVFHEALGIDGPPGMALRIVFVGNADTYGTLIGEPALAASAGAYVPPKHAIYVRMQGDDELAFSILRHEITHALIHEWVGNLPVPVNEGLAEYFRRYRVAGMGGAIDFAADRSALVEAAPPGDSGEALVELLALAGADFYAADRERRYERAYALVALLLSTPEGAAALHEVLARQKGDPCVPVPAERILDARYPGGLSALAADWARFLHDPAASLRTIRWQNTRVRMGR
jgi:hypothetical protein